MQDGRDFEHRVEESDLKSAFERWMFSAADGVGIPTATAPVGPLSARKRRSQSHR